MEKKPTEKEMLDRIMKGLGVSFDEAKEIYAYDKEVDKMKVTEASADLTPEQKKASKKYTNTGTKKPTAYKLEKRERKPNETKAEIIAGLRGFLVSIGCNDVEVANAERLITFGMSGNKYDLTLVQKRK